jgi:hypothetical protein
MKNQRLKRENKKQAYLIIIKYNFESTIASNGESKYHVLL